MSNNGAERAPKLTGLHRALSSLMILAALGIPSVHAESFFLATDVPTMLNGANRLPWEIVRKDGGAYNTVLTLPAGSDIDGMHHMDSGDWLLSFSFTTSLGGLTFEPEDVARYDPSGAYAMFFDGSLEGVPAGSNVDAVLLDRSDAGPLVLSFDVPTTLGPLTYGSSDLVQFTAAGFTMFFDGFSAGIGDESNMTGADLRDTRIIMTFDIPTTLGSTTFLPGELVAWDGTLFASFDQDPLWPAGSRINALSLLANPGRVPIILLGKVAGFPNELIVSWQPSCSAGADDYGIYEGQLGNWSSHVSIDCSDDFGDLSEQISISAANHYYLVVPHNKNDEGSYGLDSGGSERPVGGGACVATRTITPCP